MGKKKIFCLVALLFSFALYAQTSNKSDNSDVDMYVLQTSMNLRTLSINDYEYFMFYGDTYATILEILPIDENTCKLVISVPWNRAGSFQNYVIYLKAGDVLKMATRTQVAVGIVGDFDYNEIPFIGIAK